MKLPKLFQSIFIDLYNDKDKEKQKNTSVAELIARIPQLYMINGFKDAEIKLNLLPNGLGEKIKYVFSDFLSKLQQYSKKDKKALLEKELAPESKNSVLLSSIFDAEEGDEPQSIDQNEGPRHGYDIYDEGYLARKYYSLSAKDICR